MRSKIAVCQEWFWSKKEEKQEEPEDKTGEILHRLWAYVRFYNKNMVKHYEQAMETMCKDYSKFLTWSVYGKNDYEISDAQNEKIMKWSKSLPKYFSTCQRETTSIVQRDLGVRINTGGENIYFIDPGYPWELDIVEYNGFTSLSAQWFESIQEKFKDPDANFVKKILDIVNKEKSNMVPFDYEVKKPTFRKLVNEFIHSDKSNDVWDSGLCDAMSVIYGADDQGYLLHDPDGYTEEKFNSDIEKLSNL